MAFALANTLLWVEAIVLLVVAGVGATYLGARLLEKHGHAGAVTAAILHE